MGDRGLLVLQKFIIKREAEMRTISRAASPASWSSCLQRPGGSTCWDLYLDFPLGGQLTNDNGSSNDMETIVNYEILALSLGLSPAVLLT